MAVSPETLENSQATVLVPIEEFAELKAVVQTHSEELTDLRAAVGLSSDPIRRQAQLSITAWTASTLGWWAGALGSMQLNKEFIGPAITSAWGSSYNPLFGVIFERLQNINPNLLPVAQETLPFFIGFAFGGAVGHAAGKFAGTELALWTPVGSFMKNPLNAEMPKWIQDLSPQRLAQKASILLPSFRKSYS